MSTDMTSNTSQQDAELAPVLKRHSVLNATLWSTALGAVLGGAVGALAHKISPNSNQKLWHRIIDLGGSVGLINGLVGYSRADATNRKIDQVIPHVERLSAERDEARNKLNQIEGTLRS